MPSLYFPSLAGGWDPNAPPRSMGPEGPNLFRAVWNVIARRGILQRRPSVVTINSFSQPVFEGVSSIGVRGPIGEYPVWIHAHWMPVEFASDVASSAPCSTAWRLDSYGTSIIVLVTNRRVLTYRSGTWKDLTPTYTTGTVAATNGSKVVTGSGTAWRTRFITPYQFILIDGNWYEICSVGSDTSITLSTNFTGSTAAGKSYSIKRNWSGGSAPPLGTSLLFCKIFNGDLYIAGSHLGGGDGGATSYSPGRKAAVIKVADVYSPSIATSGYLTGSVDYTGSLDIVPAMDDIVGIDALQEGSVIVAGNDNFGVPTIWYSSNTNPAVWTTSPGGSFPVVYKSGQMNSKGNLGSDLTLHFEDGVVLASPIAQADPPLVLRDTSAASGVFCPRTLKTLDGVEIGLASDGAVYAFDGNNTTNISEPVASTLETNFMGTMRYGAFASIDKKSSTYWLFYQLSVGITEALSFNTKSNQWFRHRFAFPIGAVSDREGQNASQPVFGRQLVGVSNFDFNSGGGLLTSCLYQLAYRLDNGSAGIDAPANFAGVTAGAHFFETDDLDFGEPLRLKSIQRVIIWFRGPSQNFIVKKSRDGGATYEGSRTVSSVASGSVGIVSVGEAAVQFAFDELAGSTWRIHVETTGDTLSAAPTRMVVVYELGAELPDVGF